MNMLLTTTDDTKLKMYKCSINITFFINVNTIVENLSAVKTTKFFSYQSQ